MSPFGVPNFSPIGLRIRVLRRILRNEEVEAKVRLDLDVKRHLIPWGSHGNI